MSEKHEQESDALTVARWCWPESTWILVHDEPMTSDGLVFSEGEHDSLDGWYAVEDAERVLVERGEVEAYGFALWLCLFGESAHDAYEGAEFAKIAMAAPEVRVRAMAAVIRALKEKR